MKITRVGICFGIFIFLLFPYQLYCWDGYDYETGSYVEIEEGNLVREGEEIEIYDYSKGEYTTVEVEDVERSGDTVEIEIYDDETGENRTIEMEDN